VEEKDVFLITNIGKCRMLGGSINIMSNIMSKIVKVATAHPFIFHKHATDAYEVTVYFFVTLRILPRSIGRNDRYASNTRIHQMSVNGAQILSCSNDHEVDDLTNEVDDVTRLLKPEKEMYE